MPAAHPSDAPSRTTISLVSGAYRIPGVRFLPATMICASLGPVRARSATFRLASATNTLTHSRSAFTTFHPPRLQDKVAIVTGSSSGLGRAIALAYASHGTSLVICADLNAEPRDASAQDGEATPTHELLQERYGRGKAVFVKADVGIEKDMEGCVAEAVKRGGRLDMYVQAVSYGSASSHGRL
jgi:hypothetical protein